MDGVLNLERQRCAAPCLCGQCIAPALARLGSPWCHDCRDDHRRRDAALDALHARVATPRAA